MAKNTNLFLGTGVVYLCNAQVHLPSSVDQPEEGRRQTTNLHPSMRARASRACEGDLGNSPATAMGSTGRPGFDHPAKVAQRVAELHVVFPRVWSPCPQVDGGDSPRPRAQHAKQITSTAHARA